MPVLHEDTVGITVVWMCPLEYMYVCDPGYDPQVTQHCFWTDLREQRPNSFSLSQKREDMVFFLQTGPAQDGTRVRDQTQYRLR